MTRRLRRWRGGARSAVWGWRRGQWGYAVVPAMRAAQEGLPVIARADLERNWVTVASR
jgi:hypothetical protein